MNQINNPKFNPSETEKLIVGFINDTFTRANKNLAVIAVSGGIDSAVSLCLLSEALGKENVLGLMLPYADQDMSDARLILDFCQIPEQNRKTVNIQPVVEKIESLVSPFDPDSIGTQGDNVAQGDNAKQKRVGNIMARVRMIVLYDWAAKLDALVCGTENKSEKYLGYFTRFGDQASDLEPIEHLYKTQVYELAHLLHLPDRLITKPPSAELWSGQTDENELGFTYTQADSVLQKLIDEKIPAENISLENVDPETVKKIISRVEFQAFKLVVPYKVSG
ncbi:MAG TPA: NAD+ synthase [Candidatus Woesebacteria bacterium]|nr:NAD+ synthase [Candidatus Woesebacteria bacterium]